MQLSKSLKIARGLSLYSLLIVIGLLPLFFLPFSPINSSIAKGYFLVIGTIISLIGFVAESIITGKIYIPKNIISRSIIGVLLAFFVSSLFAPNINYSLWGQAFEIGTFGSILSLTIIYYLSCYHFEDPKNIKRFLNIFSFSFVGSFIIIFSSLFLGNLKWFSKTFQSIYGATPAGSWNNLVIIASILCVVSIIKLELHSLSRKAKFTNWFIAALAMFVMALVNFKTAWLVLGIFGLVSFVYILAFHRAKSDVEQIEEDAKIKFPLASFIIVFFSLIFYVGNPVFGNLLGSKLNFSNIDVRPSVSLTAKTFVSTIKESPKKAILGYSPNNFDNAWQKHLPEVIMQTNFWDTRFSAGVSHILTWFVTTGILGALALLYFLLTYCAVAIRVLLRTAKTGTPDPDLVIPFMISFLSWLYMAIYVPGLSVVAIAFASTGLLIGVLTSKKVIRRHEFDYLPDPRFSFFSIMSLVVVLILSITSIYFTSVKFFAFHQYSKGVSSADVQKTVKYISSAIRLNPKSDLFQRSLSIVYTGQATTLINSNRNNIQSVSSQISEYIKLGEAAALLATKTAPNNSINWKNLGSFYELVQSLGQDRETAYKSGIEAYNNALMYSPKDASLTLAKARLEYRNDNKLAAYDYINKAIEIKPNYDAAFLLLATFKVNELDTTGAIENYKKAINANPTSVDNYVLLANLYNNNGDYNNAAIYYRGAFIASNRTSANIAFTLAEVDIKTKNYEEAKFLINELKKSLPDNQQVKDLEQKLNNTSSGNTEDKDN